MNNSSTSLLNQAHYRPSVSIETGTGDGSDENCGSAEGILISKTNAALNKCLVSKDLFHCVSGHASEPLSCLKVGKFPRKLKLNFSQIGYGG